METGFEDLIDFEETIPAPTLPTCRSFYGVDLCELCEKEDCYGEICDFEFNLDTLTNGKTLPMKRGKP